MAIYCRVSTSDQDNDRQERDLLDYAERAGFEVIRLSESEKLSQRGIAKRLGISKTTVNEILKRENNAAAGQPPDA